MPNHITNTRWFDTTPSLPISHKDVRSLSPVDSTVINRYLDTGDYAEQALSLIWGLAAPAAMIPVRYAMFGLIQFIDEYCKHYNTSISNQPYHWQYNLFRLIYDLHELYGLSFYAELFHRRRELVDNVVTETVTLLDERVRRMRFVVNTAIGMRITTLGSADVKE